MSSICKALTRSLGRTRQSGRNTRWLYHPRTAESRTCRCSAPLARRWGSFLSMFAFPTQEYSLNLGIPKNLVIFAYAILDSDFHQQFTAGPRLIKKLLSSSGLWKAFDVIYTLDFRHSMELVAMYMYRIKFTCTYSTILCIYVYTWPGSPWHGVASSKSNVMQVF